MKILLFSICIILTAQIELIGQIDSAFNCGTHYSKLSKDEKNSLDEIERVILSKRLSSSIYDSATIYTIPVVFNVFNLGEPVGVGSNLSEEKIQTILKEINDAFRARKAFFDKGNDTKIQFIFAGVDEGNNDFNGIRRFDMSYVLDYKSNGVNLLNLNNSEILTEVENKSFYGAININIFWRIKNAGAFAYFNGSLFMQISNPVEIYAHEMGHSLNLFHTFEGDNDGQNCPPNTNPETEGDRVSDTPPHRVFEIYEPDEVIPCTGGLFGDLSYNFMAYYNKEFRFTAGQIKRSRQFSFEENTRSYLLNYEKEIFQTVCLPTFQSGFTNFLYLQVNSFFGKNIGIIANLNVGSAGIVGNTPYSNYKKEDVISVEKNISYNVQIQAFGSQSLTIPNGKVEIYIDKNRDGNFDSLNELIASTNSNYFNGNLTLPNSLIEGETYIVRIVASLNQNSTSCNLLNYYYDGKTFIGNIADVAIQVSASSCNFQIPTPTVKNYKVVSEDFAILKSNGCLSGMTNWYTDTLTNTIIARGQSYITPTLYTSKTYFVRCEKAGCLGQFQKIEVAVLGSQDTLEIKPKVIDINQATTLTITGCNGTVSWFNSEFGGNSISQGPILSTPPLTHNTSYFAECLQINGYKKRNRQIGNVYVINNQITVQPTLNVNFCNSSYLNLILNKTTPDTGPYQVLFFKNGNPTGVFSIDNVVQAAFSNNFFDNSGIYSYIIIHGKTSSNFGNLNVSKSFEPGIVSNEGNVFPLSTIVKCSTASVKVYALLLQQNNILLRDNGVYYKWYKGGVLLNGQNENYLNINESGSYTLEAYNNSCSKLWNFNIYNSNLMVMNRVPNSIEIENQNDNPICQGNNVKLISQYKSQSATYQWFLNDVPLTNGNISSLIPVISGKYKLLVTENNCNISSSEKDIVIGDKIPFEMYTTNEVLGCGNFVSFSFNKNSYSSSEVKIDLFKNGGQVSSYYGAIRKANLSIYEEGNYFAILKSGNCIVKSNTIKIIHSKNISPPMIQEFNDLGTKYLMAVGHIKTPFKWYKDNVPFAENIFSFEVTSSGVYKVESGIGLRCSKFSDEHIVSEFSSGIQISSDKTILCGLNDNITLKPNINADPNVSLQWFRNDIAITDSQWYNSYYYVSLPGTYHLVVTTGTNSKSSNKIIITQHTGSQLQIISKYSNLWCTNQPIELSLNGQHSSITSGVLWYKNGVQMQNQNGIKIYVSESGNYSASINQFGCIGTTPAIPVNYGNPTFTLIPSNTLNIGQSANLIISNCSGKVRWYDSANSTDPIKIQSDFTTPPLYNNTTYYVSCEENDCISERVAATIYVCNMNLNFTTNIDSGIYKASDSIEARVNVPSNTIFQAAKKIILTPGFQAGSNEVFEAKIGGCN